MPADLSDSRASAFLWDKHKGKAREPKNTALSVTAAMGAMQGPTQAELTSLNFSLASGVFKAFNELLFYFTVRPHFP